MEHELHRCLPPLQLTQEMREFETAPTPPPAVPIPFPPGLFSPLATPPPHHTAFRFGGSVLGPMQGAAAAAAGGGAGVVPGLPEVPVGPLPLLSTPPPTVTPRQQHEQQQQPPQLAQPQPPPSKSVPGKPWREMQAEGDLEKQGQALEQKWCPG